jgi:hypothetical protein
MNFYGEREFRYFAYRLKFIHLPYLLNNQNIFPNL